MSKDLWQNRLDDITEGKGPRTLKFRDCFDTGELVALDYLTWMETHDEEVLRFFQEFAGKNDHHVR